MRKTFKICLAMLMLCGITAFGSGKSAKKVGELKFGFVVGSFEHVFYQLIQQGIEAECKAKGVGTYTVLDASLDPVIATSKVENLTAQGCDAIALACNDAAGVKPAIENADKEGVKMFTFDCTSQSDAINCFVGTDNYKGGILGGQELVRLTKDGDTVAIIGFPNPSSCIDRENGALEVLAKANRKVLKGYDYKGDANEAQKIMETILTQYPDVKAVFCVGDPAATGALASIKAAGSNCLIIGFDGNPEAKAAILDAENGKYWVSEISQDPKQIGARIVDEMISYMESGKVSAKEIFIEPYIITAANAKN
ncbi:MAG: substrate-binding domain-containing protein [Fusobacteriaceae bacterium]|jgi:ribose transport system substrate-binding protein|nr:substrate-binding domain-containing protein [Fusobacteriaceae bacterium]